MKFPIHIHKHGYIHGYPYPRQAWALPSSSSDTERKEKHNTIKLEATGKHTNTSKHTKKVKLHQNLIQILYNTILNP